MKGSKMAEDTGKQGCNVTMLPTDGGLVRGYAKVYNSNAERQQAYRERAAAAEREQRDAFEAFREAFIQAIERGNSEELTNHRSDDPAEWCREMAAELEKWKLVAHERDS
jgi:hypothetical protein